MFVIRAIGYALVRTHIFLAVMGMYLAIWAVLLRFDNGVVSSIMSLGFILVFSLTITALEKWQWGNLQLLSCPGRIQDDHGA